LPFEKENTGERNGDRVEGGERGSKSKLINHTGMTDECPA